MSIRASLVSLAVVLMIWPAAARAGTYDVYSCRLPDGRPAPTFGWSAVSLRAVTSDTCASGGSLRAALPSERSFKGDMAGWTLTAPADTRIVSFVAYRWSTASSDAAGGSRDYFTVYDDLNPLYLGGPSWREYCMSHFGSCRGFGVPSAAPLDPVNRLERGSLTLSRLGFQVLCWEWGNAYPDPPPGECKPTSNPGEVRVFQTRVTLEDQSAPAIVSDEKALVSRVSSVLTGKTTLEIDAQDRGSGVAETVAEVDGVDQAAIRVADAACVVPFVEFRPVLSASRLAQLLIQLRSRMGRTCFDSRCATHQAT